MQLLKDLFEKKEIKPDSKSAMQPVSNSISNDLSSLGEDEVKVSELCYRRLFEAAQDGILIIDAESGRITDVNPFLLDLLSYSREEFIGKPLWRFGPFKDIRANKAAFQDLVRDGYIRYEHLPLETRDGRSVEVEFISNVYQVGKNRTIQCNIRDISERNRAEKVRSDLETQLKQAQKMKTVATLAGGMAHQFNNSLSIIYGGLSLLESQSQPITDGCFQYMKDAANKMARLTRQLLAYARGGKSTLDTFLLSELVTDSLPLFKRSLKPSITIEREMTSDLPRISANREQMKMALLSILDNAAEAIETQGIIRITCHKEVFTDDSAKPFYSMPPGIYACFTVADNGRGMDEETRSRVFEPFFTTHFTGRGLGMAATYGIVKNHDGWISVMSQRGKGTTVKIWLPAYYKNIAKAAAKLTLKRTIAVGGTSVIEDEVTMVGK